MPAINYRLLIGLALVVAVLDQATKLWVVSTLDFGTFYPPDRIDVVAGFFHIVHVGNTGAAWSFFSGNSAALAVFGVVAIAGIFLMRRSLELYRRSSQWSFGLIIGGILGNIADRIRLGHVVDFLDFQFGSFHWPSFNVADSGICIGVGLYLVNSLRARDEGAKP